jgi:BA14K-like protein
VNNLAKSFICAATVCFAALHSGSAPAAALPAIGATRPDMVAVRKVDNIEQVQYRGRYYGHRRNSGRNVALGIGAAIIGGIVLSETARAEHRRDHSSAWDRCAETYRSFEPSTGMYTGYDGVRRTCPYLN